MGETVTKKSQWSMYSCISQIIVYFIIGIILGDRGISYLAVTLEVLFLLLALSNGGITEAIGNLWSVRKEKSQFRNLDKLKKSVFYQQLILGICLCILLFFTADVIARVIFNASAIAILFKIMAFIIPIRMVSSAYLGFYKGEGRLYSASWARIFRSILTLAATVIMMGGMSTYGNKVGALLNQGHMKSIYQCVAVMIAILISDVFVLVGLIIIYEKRIRVKTSYRDSMRLTESNRQCLFSVFQKRTTSIVVQTIMLLPLLVSYFYWNKTSNNIDGYYIYGSFIRNFGMVIIAIALVYFVFLLPTMKVIVDNINKKEIKIAKRVFSTAIHGCLATGMFLAVFMTVMAGQIAPVFTSTTTVFLENVFSSSSIAIVLLLLGTFLYFFLLEMNMQKKAIIIIGTSVIVYVVGVGIGGLIKKQMMLFPTIWALLCMIIACVGMWFVSVRIIRIRWDWMAFVVFPVGAGCMVGLLCMLFSKLLSPHLGNLFTLITSYIIFTGVYWFVLLMLRNFREKELQFIPGGKLIRLFGKLFRIF